MSKIIILIALLILKLHFLNSVKFIKINDQLEIGKQWEYSFQSKADALNLKNITIYIRVIYKYNSML